LGENKHHVSERIGGGAFLVTSEEVSLVANADVEVGKTVSTKENKSCFGS